MSARIEGGVAPGFGPVADAFRSNIEDRDDRGAACVVMLEGSPVVDLCAGEASPGRAWTPSTRAVSYSVSKGVTAICLLMAAQEGALDLDAPVARVWPQFAAQGKDRVTPRQVLAHRAGLPAPSRPWTLAELEAWDPVVEDLAAQRPLWTPGESFMYHAVTVGYHAGEILRRATGMRPSQWLSARIAEPLGLDVTFGADPQERGLARVAQPARPAAPDPALDAETVELTQRALLMDGPYGPDLFAVANTAPFLLSESPGANLVASAGDLARLYSATVDSTAGERLLSDETVAAATRPISRGRPHLGPDRGDVWGSGFMLHSGRRGMVGPGSFGHDGAAGQLAFAHPGHRVGFAYQTNQPGPSWDVRAEALCAALRECLSP